MENIQQTHLFVIGPQRSGTTWLYEYFSTEQQNVFIDRVEKENYFFAKATKRNSVQSKDKFLKKLSGHGQADLLVDVCSTYFGHPKAILRILECFPNAKFAYIYRPENSRKKSFTEHRKFNQLSAWILGYGISWKLYHLQSRFDEFEGWLKENIPSDRLCRLEFSDLVSSKGQRWIETIEAFTHFKLDEVSLGVVNKSRKDAAVFKRVLFMGVRMIQYTRVHIYIKRFLLMKKNPELILANHKFKK